VLWKELEKNFNSKGLAHQRAHTSYAML
jgi:hypothetical protein